MVLSPLTLSIQAHKCLSTFVFIAVRFLRDHPDLPSHTPLTPALREQHIKDLLEVLRLLQNGNNLAKEYLAWLDGEDKLALWDLRA